MIAPSICGINIYPIKSTQGIALPNANVFEQGLELDRQFVITDLNGKFITGRTKARLVLVQSQVTDFGFIISAPSMDDLIIRYDLFSTTYQNVQVWQDDINAQHCSDEVDQWFSTFLGTACKLFFYGKQSSRQIKDYNQQVSFADGYPLLLISKASLNDLNAKATDTIDMAQFRPNLVVDSCEAFAEDSWHKIAIGNVEFLVAKPCSRCIFTTVSADNANRHPNKEPLLTLQKYRTGADKQIYFGQNLIPLNKGIINLGDTIKVISTKPAEVYL
ncbi:MOSC domain-containing protein [Colwelliaceae bacterium BS250]